MRRPISFSIHAAGPGLARAGSITTPHGVIETPAFIAVGTKANVKGIEAGKFPSLGIQALIANTYHLYLSPGERVVASAGGVGAFMGWKGPTMTDSGGFQVFSLGVAFGRKLSKFVREEAPREQGVAIFDEDIASEHGKLAVVDDEGVSFTSHLDGSLHRFTPERSIEIQQELGADIIFAFDEFVEPLAPREVQRKSMERTHAWARRSLTAHRRNIGKDATQGIYGIVQGGRWEDLRVESARTIGAMEFDGYGIGGSFNKDDILGILDTVSSELPEEKPRHLLGIGEPEDIFIGVAAGMDTFDCVLPTRNGRTGGVYTSEGKIQITGAQYRDDPRPLDAGCLCPTCASYSRAYVSHLFRCHEMLGPVLASAHNIFFLTNLTRAIRAALLNGSFEALRDTFVQTYRRKA